MTTLPSAFACSISSSSLSSSVEAASAVVSSALDSSAFVSSAFVSAAAAVVSAGADVLPEQPASDDAANAAAITNATCFLIV